MARSEKGIQAFPKITDDGRSAGRGFEKTDTGRIPCFYHLLPSEIKREPLLIVECSVFPWREVSEAFYILRPANLPWVLRSRDRKCPVTPGPGWFQEQLFQAGLTVVTIGAHVTQIPFRFPGFGIVERFIHRAIQRPRNASAVSTSNHVQHAAASER